MYVHNYDLYTLFWLIVANIDNNWLKEIILILCFMLYGLLPTKPGAYIDE